MRVLSLNASMEPLQTISVRRAVNLILVEKVEPIPQNGHYLNPKHRAAVYCTGNGHNLRFCSVLSSQVCRSASNRSSLVQVLANSPLDKNITLFPIGNQQDEHSLAPAIWPASAWSLAILQCHK